MLRFFHVADTHLGYQAYNRLTPAGLNQREVDFQDAFRRCVDRAVASKPDLFLHGGDLFDHPRPNNRAIAFALEQVRRLSEAAIPTVLVSGNHDAPRMRETGSIFRVFEGLANVHTVYRGPQRVQVGAATVHAVPQAITQEAFQKQLAGVVTAGAGQDLLLVHGTVLGVDGLFTSEFNEYQIPFNALRDEFDYIALGHFHNRKALTQRAHYSGSLEACSFNEAGESKGWIEGRLGASLEIEFHSAAARPMLDLGVMDATRAQGTDVQDWLRQRLEAAPAGSIVRATVESIDRSLARSVDWDRLRGHRSDLFHVELRVRPASQEHAIDGGLHLGPITQEFDEFLARRPLPGLPRERVREKAVSYLSREASTGAA